MITPSHLVDNQFLQFAADNIDLIVVVLDGKGTFYAMQCGAFLCGGNSSIISRRAIGKDRALGPFLSDDFNKFLDCGYCGRQRPIPVFDVEIQKKWFSAEESTFNQANQSLV